MNPGPCPGISRAEKKAHVGVGLVGVKPELQPTEQYRRSSLGMALQTTLDQMMMIDDKFTNEFASKILLHFDTQVAGKLATATPRVRFRCEEIVNVKEVDKVYNALLKRCEVNVKGIGFGKDDAVLSNVEVLGLEMWPSAGIKKRHGSTIVIVQEKAQTEGNSPGQENSPTGDAGKVGKGKGQVKKKAPTKTRKPRKKAAAALPKIFAVKPAKGKKASVPFNFEDDESYGESDID